VLLVPPGRVSWCACPTRGCACRCQLCTGGGAQRSPVRVRGLGCKAQGSGLRVQGSGFRVQGSGLRVQGLGFRA
jgi:hypothetical protein